MSTGHFHFCMKGRLILRLQSIWEKQMNGATNRLILNSEADSGILWKRCLTGSEFLCFTLDILPITLNKLESVNSTSQKSVLRIHLILIRILDTHWAKMYPDPGHFFKIYWIFLTKNNFQLLVLFFSLIFILKLDEPFRNEEIFIISFFKSSSWV